MTGLASNLLLTVPIVLVVALFVWLPAVHARWLQERQEHDQEGEA